MTTLTCTSRITDSAGKVYSDSYLVTMTGTAEAHGVTNVGTSEETITVPTDIGDLGRWRFVNRDDTNFVEIGQETGVYVCELMPGEHFEGRGPAALSTWYVKADTAACDLEHNMWEA